MKHIISDFAENPGMNARDEGARGNKRETKGYGSGERYGFSASDVNLRKKPPRFSAGKFISKKQKTTVLTVDECFSPPKAEQLNSFLL